MNKEKYKLLTQMYVSTNDIMIICELSKRKANQLRQEIEKECSDMLLPRFKVPTKKLIEKKNINIDEIYKNAEREVKLGGIK